MKAVVGRITSLEGDLGIDIFVSEHSFVPNEPPCMVAQVYDESDEDEAKYLGAAFLSEAEATELRNHLDAFIRWCARHPNRGVKK